MGASRQSVHALAIGSQELTSLGAFDRASAFEACKQTVRSSGTSFYWAMSLLPSEQRASMYALYSFCRKADDIADDPMPETLREESFSELEAEIEAIYARRCCSGAEMAALGETIWRCRIPRLYLQAIIDGCRQDSRVHAYPNYASLEGYCHRVSTAVGLATAHIAGLRGVDIWRYARSGAVAVQLTNILRDVDEDRRRGRVYLPLDWLVAEGVERGSVLAGRSSEGLRRVVRRLADRARRLYVEAALALNRRQKRALAVLELVQVLYRPLLGLLEKRGYEVFGPRLRLSNSAKLGRAVAFYAGRAMPGGGA